VDDLFFAELFFVGFVPLDQAVGEARPSRRSVRAAGGGTG
jgi:hypothetical protein